ncbi:unnamed protein product [Ostreobium quekettii]|uniref:Uncharacterized protein n=1 Tax=Ostreobium quekettii TaxID=121088 RepID=A0A8S1J1U1_9CHLO|nr:unnamed protein product [Ostreobium quekettii]
MHVCSRAPCASAVHHVFTGTIKRTPSRESTLWVESCISTSDTHTTLLFFAVDGVAAFVGRTQRTPFPPRAGEVGMGATYKDVTPCAILSERRMPANGQNWTRQGRCD